MKQETRMTPQEAAKYMSTMSIAQMYDLLTVENKDAVNRLIEQLAASQSENPPSPGFHR